MRIFFAGTESRSSFMRVRRKTRYLLHSAYSLGYRRDIAMRCQVATLLLDSGGFTVRTRGIDVRVEQYADYINQMGVRYAFNLDTADVKESWRNQAYLEKHTKAYIVPIYHWDEFRNPRWRGLLDDIVSGYDFIAVGGLAGAMTSTTMHRLMFSWVFARTRNKVRVHGLGVTRREQLEAWPFYSVDSTSWIAGIRYACPVHIRSTDPRRDFYAGGYGEPGYLLDTEIDAFLKTESEVTRFWERKGVTWNDLA